jgi:hypothetical protein
MHLVPFVLIGTVDNEIGDEVSQELVQGIPLLPEWVAKHARRFIQAIICRVDDDFWFVTRKNIQRLLGKVLTLIGPEGTREYVLDIAQLAMTSFVSDEVLGVIARDGFWADVLLQDEEEVSFRKIELVGRLLQLGGFSVVCRKRIVDWLTRADINFHDSRVCDFLLLVMDSVQVGDESNMDDLHRLLSKCPDYQDRRQDTD